jgi:hypothetical protein
MIRRYGSVQVRNAATVGGNIANGSPIGDSPPALIALGATLHLRKGDSRRDPAARGLLPRLRQAGPRPGRIRRGRVHPRAARPAARLQAVETLRSGHLRRLRRVQRHGGGRHRHRRAHRLRRHGGHAETCHACRGRAHRPALDPATIEAARARFGEDYTPLSDMRASAATGWRPRRTCYCAISRRCRGTRSRCWRCAMSVQKPLPHDAAPLHVTGAARYVDDIPVPQNCLHLAFGLSKSRGADRRISTSRPSRPPRACTSSLPGPISRRSPTAPPRPMTNRS